VEAWFVRFAGAVSFAALTSIAPAIFAIFLAIPVLSVTLGHLVVL
jgi:hypothetical protein